MGIENLDNGSLKKIHIVPHSHHDYAWVHERQWHYWRYIQVFHSVLDWLRDNPQTTWMIDNVVHSLLPFIENCPERVEELKEYVRQGRIEVASGGYSLARPSYVGEESFVRNMVEGTRFFKDFFGVEKVNMFNNLDTSSGQSNLPQILKLGGFDYYRFQRPENNLDKRGIPRTFYWQGLDGSKVLVARGFGGGFLWMNYTNQDFEKEWPAIREAFYNEELAARRIDGLCPTDLEILPYGCDDSVPPNNWFDKPVRFLEFIDEWNRREKIQFEFSTSGRFFEETEKQDVPTYAGPLDENELTYNLPVKGNDSFWYMRGKLDKLLVRLENVASIAAMMGYEYPEDEILELWYQLFEITGHAIEWVYVQDADELKEIVVNAMTRAQMMTREALANIAYCVRYECGLTNVVVNPQCFDREEVVELKIPGPFGLQGFTVVDAFGETLPYQVVNKQDHFKTLEQYKRVDFTALYVTVKMRVPAFGYNAVKLVANGEPNPQAEVEKSYVTLKTQDIPCLEEDVVIDNGVLCATFSKGRLKSLRDNRKRRTAKAKRGKSLVNLRFVETPQNTGWMPSLKTVSETSMKITSWKVLANGPVMWKYRIGGTVGSAEAALDVIVKKDSPALEFELLLDHRPTKDGYFLVDFDCDLGCNTFSDVYYGIEKRDAEHTIDVGGESYIEGQIYGRNFTAFDCGRIPVALVAGDCSVYYIHNFKEGKMSLVLSRVMLFEYSNEEWFLNVPESFRMYGRHRFAFSLFLAPNAEAYGAIQQYTKRYHHPLMVTYKNNATPEEGDPQHNWFARCHKENLVQTAFYQENGEFCARFFETAGVETAAKWSFSMPLAAVESTDFYGNALESDCKLSGTGKTVTMTVRPFQIVTLRFRLK